MVEDVTRLLDHLRIRRAHIVGYSMGGAITGKFVVAHRIRVLIAGIWRRSAPRAPGLDDEERLYPEFAESLEKGKGLGPMMRALIPPAQPTPSDEAIGRSPGATGTQRPAGTRGGTARNTGPAVTLEEVRDLRIPLLAGSWALRTRGRLPSKLSSG